VVDKDYMGVLESFRHGRCREIQLKFSIRYLPMYPITSRDQNWSPFIFALSSLYWSMEFYEVNTQDFEGYHRILANKSAMISMVSDRILTMNMSVHRSMLLRCCNLVGTDHYGDGASSTGKDRWTLVISPSGRILAYLKQNEKRSRFAYRS